MHFKDTKTVLKELKTGIDGLTQDEAQKRLKLYGPNRLEEEEEKLYKLFLRQFLNPLIIVLIIAGLVALLIGEEKDALVIWAVVVINGLIGFYQETKALRSIQALRELTLPKCKVIREGKPLEIDPSQLVPGDLVVLSEGDFVPADLRIIRSEALLVDEAILTGESIPVEKEGEIVLPEETPIYERKNLLFMGTYVVKGKAEGVVNATGKRTELGKIAEKIKGKTPESPLTRALGIFARRWIFVLFIILSGLFMVGVLQERSLKDLFLFVVALLVSAVPEGLPIAVTIALVVGALRLSKNKVLARELPAVETLGSATYICTDKTGTITEGKLKVKEYHALEKEELINCSLLCNDSDGVHGDPLEVALLKWCEDMGVDWKAKREASKVLKEYPFDVKKRSMAVLVEIEGKRYLYIKGAFEALRDSLHEKARIGDLQNIHDSLAERGLRVLAFTYTEWKEERIPSSEEIEAIPLHLAGFLGFIDPPKAGVKEAIAIAKRAGIRIIMITGDNLLTARAIAKEVGIYQEPSLALEGKDLEKKSEKELYALLTRVAVVARATPEHKFLIVKTLQANGEIVVVTGDGVNDAPAIKNADLGVAMGGGAQITKDSAKLILTDNNFSVIVKAVEEGRNIARNISNLICYLLSTNAFEILYNALALLLALPFPLYGTQILWINLVTDGVQDKAYPFTRKDENLMKRAPVQPSRLFLGPFNLFRILVNGLIMALSHLILFTHLLKLFPYEVALTISFTSAVMSQWAVGIQEISPQPFFLNPISYIQLNPWIYLGISAGIVLQGLVLYMFPHYFHAVKLTFSELKWSFVCPLLIFLGIELRKWITRKFLA